MNFKFAIAASAVMALAGIFTTGCGGDVCTKAADQLTACGVGGETVSGSPMELTCSGVTSCNADCVTKATCEQLVDGFSGMPDLIKSKPFFDCTTKCAMTK
jgi:hypothetical protein